MTWWVRFMLRRLRWRLCFWVLRSSPDVLESLTQATLYNTARALREDGHEGVRYVHWRSPEDWTAGPPERLYVALADRVDEYWADLHARTGGAGAGLEDHEGLGGSR